MPNARARTHGHIECGPGECGPGECGVHVASSRRRVLGRRGTYYSCRHPTSINDWYLLNTRARNDVINLLAVEQHGALVLPH
eukprot:752297-Prymnesium_polylepis.1